MQNPGSPADGHSTALEKTSTDPVTSHNESSDTGNVSHNVGVQDGEKKEVAAGNEKEVAVEDNTQAAVGDDSENAAEEPEDHSKYLTGFKLWILTLGLCLTTFVIALDNTIIATAIPKITTVFNSLEDVGWYGSSYLLTTTSLQPSFGKIYTYFDVKYTYLFALVLFEVGSIICAAATSSPMFIVGRAVAGAGAAALFSGGMNIIGYSVALAKRPIYIAALSSMFGIASIVGPILGGVLTDRASWR
jgi:fucose permease